MNRDDADNRLTNRVDAVSTAKSTFTSGGELFNEVGPLASDTVTNVYINRLRTGLKLPQPTGVWANGYGAGSASRPSGATTGTGTNPSHPVFVYDGLARFREQLS